MTPNEAFDNYLNQFDLGVQHLKTRDLRVLLQKPYWTISDWRRGRVKIDIAWQAKISEVLGEDIFADCETSNK